MPRHTQCKALDHPADQTSTYPTTVLDAFGVLRGLCEERLEAASADEC
eukprot:COSAG02_NODE_73638_length_169_cov_26.585714_1_plen_47_part_01